jgi:uroporphyrinogen-III synthase
MPSVDRRTTSRSTIARDRTEKTPGPVTRRRTVPAAATSPAAARWLWDGLGESERARLRGTPAVALGASTRAALAERGISRIEITPGAGFREALRMLAALAAGVAAQ